MEGKLSHRDCHWTPGEERCLVPTAPPLAHGQPRRVRVFILLEKDLIFTAQLTSAVTWWHRTWTTVVSSAAEKTNRIPEDDGFKYNIFFYGHLIWCHNMKDVIAFRMALVKRGYKQTLGCQKARESGIHWWEKLRFPAQPFSPNFPE